MSIFEDKKFDDPTNVEIFLKSGGSISLRRIADLSFKELEDGYIRAISINNEGKNLNKLLPNQILLEWKNQNTYLPS